MSSIIIFINFERKTSTATHIQKQQQQNQQTKNQRSDINRDSPNPMIIFGLTTQDYNYKARWNKGIKIVWFPGNPTMQFHFELASKYPGMICMQLGGVLF